MMFASLDLQSSLLLIAIFVSHHQGSIDVSLDTVGVSVKLLLCGNELIKSQLVLVLSWEKNLIEPSCDIFDCFVRVFRDLLLVFPQGEKKQELPFDRVFDYFLNCFPSEVHLCQDVLKDCMDDISKYKRIVDISLYPLILLGQVGFASARERFHDLSRWNEDVWLDNDHATF